jgi:exodeoxyribonuclease-1
VTFSYYWHDYETFGANPALDRPSQFAGIRTDENFNILGEPLVIYCKPARDVLPQPDACLITGITPQLARERGVVEAEFIRQIHQQFAQANTCAVGYNSIRFDDEVTRYTLYRNFYDPYAREWQNGNSRWDLIDMVRVCRALRPEGIEWPDHADGTPSFKLEDLTRANAISHHSAHDALSDVHATIAMAQLVKQRQPRVFDYLLRLRDKRRVLEVLDVINQKPVLHTSAMYPASRLCTTLVMPLAQHPTNKSGVICYDLTVDPRPLLELTAEQIRQRLYTPRDQLAEGVERIPLKTIHTNRCPVVATTQLLNEEVAGRLHIDLVTARQHYQQIKQATGLAAKLAKVFSEADFPKQTDPDQMLYSGGFFGQRDKEAISLVRNSLPEELAATSFAFEDKRLDEMLFRYRARNYPETLTTDEQGLWEEYRYQRLTEPGAGGSIVLEEYLGIIEEKLAAEDCSERDRQLLQALIDYSDDLLA